MKRISCVALAFCLLLCGACAAGREYTAEDVSGKVYIYEKEGFGSDFIIRIYPDGTAYYYVGALSSYIGLGDWAVEGGVLTLTDCETIYNYVNRFRIGENDLTYLAEGSTGFMYLTPEDGERFHGAEMEPVEMAGHTGEFLSLDLVRQLVLNEARQEYIAALLRDVTREELVTHWGEPTGMLSGLYGNIWDLDEARCIIVYFGADDVVTDVRVHEKKE